MRIKRLTEMAMQHQRMIDRCCEKGEQFIEHFIKIMEGGLNDIDFKHHCSELIGYFNSIKNIVCKSDNKLISNEDLDDYFFTVCSNYDIIFNNIYEHPEYIEIYKKLEEYLLNNRNNKNIIVSDFFESVLR